MLNHCSGRRVACRALKIAAGTAASTAKDNRTRPNASIDFRIRSILVICDHPIAAITFNSIAIGVGSAVTSIVVRVGFGLAGPAKYCA